VFAVFYWFDKMRTMNYRLLYLTRVLKATKFLRFVPFLRMLGLNGSVVRGEESKESDIDFLIIAKKNRLYTARFFATALTELTGYRRKGDKVAGRICLNCYLPHNRLNITPSDPESKKKVARAYKYLIALVDDRDFEKRFFSSNRWFAGYNVSGARYSDSLKGKLLYLINDRTYRTGFTGKRALRPKKWGEKLLVGRFGDWVEKKLMSYQVKRILSGKRAGDEIVCKKNEIRLHPKKNKSKKIAL
jgi:predicted nucleotidyltransferase